MDANRSPMPRREEMVSAFMDRNPEWEGVFYTGVTTTGIFCRPTCPARKPRPGNLRFFATAREALQAGFRPCRRCRPVEPSDAPPGWLRPLMDAVEADPARRWRDADLRERGFHPERVRRWFKRHHGMSFHAYCRARRLGLALGSLRNGGGVLDTGLAHGWESASGFQEAVQRWLGEPPRSAATAPTVYLERLATPLGTMLAGATDEALCLLEFADRRQLETQLKRIRQRLQCRFLPTRNGIIARAESELAEYFDGKRRDFGVPLALAGTDFQETVWRALMAIPYGATESYADLARRIERPTAVRAVARANGDNRMPIVIPCHRVIGTNGTLTGYGGGLWRKQRLLELERFNRDFGADFDLSGPVEPPPAPWGAESGE